MNPCTLASGLCWIGYPRQMGLTWQLVAYEDRDGLWLVVATRDGGEWAYPVFTDISGMETTLGAIIARLAVAA